MKGPEGQDAQYVTKGKEIMRKSLEEMYPLIAEFWDASTNGVEADKVFPGSEKKYWWKCDKGHRWYRSICAMTRYRKANCPVCNGRTLMRGINDFASVCPNLLDEWDYEKNNINPHDITYGTHKKAFWKCKKGHSWEASIHGRRNGNKCPICSGMIPEEGVNDLQTLYPELMGEWNYEENCKRNLFPNMLKEKSNQKASWKCKKGHIWDAVIAQRTQYCTSCPYCVGAYAIPGQTDFMTIFPELISEINFEKNSKIKLEMLKPGSDKIIWWKCSRSHEWKASIANRTRKKSGCPYCAGNKVIVGENDLNTKCPDLALEWNNEKNLITASECAFRSHKKYWWKCEYGHEWKASPHNRAVGDGCPMCFKNRR